MAKNKKSRKKLFIFGGLGLLLVIIIAMVIIGGSKEEIITVQTEKVSKRSITETVTATGTIEPEFKVVITPEVTGEIITLPVKDGQSVVKGQQLIRIKGDAYAAQRDRAAANLQAAKAARAMALAELTKVKADYNRIKELNAKRLASDAELETAKSMLDQRQASYESSEANVLQAEASLKEVMEQLSKTTIISPMDGTVTQLNVEIGERVLGSGFSQGTNIMTVSDLRSMEAIVNVDENDVVHITIGDTARVKIDAFGNKEFRGVVKEIGNSAITSGMNTNEQVVNFQVKIKLIDLDPNLRPGMSCNASIETETKSNVISVPIQSVTARKMDKAPAESGDGVLSVKTEKKGDDEVQEIVYVIEGGKAKSVNVVSGISDNSFIEIKEGLKEGAEVVSGSYQAISRELSDGAIVRVENTKGAPKK